MYYRVSSLLQLNHYTTYMIPFTYLHVLLLFPNVITSHLKHQILLVKPLQAAQKSNFSNKFDPLGEKGPRLTSRLMATYTCLYKLPLHPVAIYNTALSRH